jgi:hypothetical protein
LPVSKGEPFSGAFPRKRTGVAGRSREETHNDDDKAFLADAACQAAQRSDPGELPPDQRASLQAAADKAWFELAVYRAN